MSPVAKYHEIARALRRQIEAGGYVPGERAPSENALARRFGVSRPTAARALRELESAGLVVRRAGSGTFVRAREADVRVAGAGRTFGLLVQGLGATEVLDPICTEITRACQSQGSTVLWGGVDRPSDAVDELARLSRYYLQRQVDGVFFAPLETAVERERENVRVASELAAAGIAVVLLDRELLDFPGRSDLDLVGIDNIDAGLRLGAHLIRMGHRRICFLSRPHHPSTTDLRVLGVWTALQQAGVTPLGNWRVSADPLDLDVVRDVIARADAVVCSNDLTAALLIQSVQRLGASVPADLAVVGFDDVGYSTLLSVELTTMRQPCQEIARAAVAAMHDRLDHRDMEPRQILLKSSLVVRRSCGRQSGVLDRQAEPLNRA